MFDWDEGARSRPIHSAAPSGDDAPMLADDAADASIDRELEAAIEYKIAADGADGVALILDLVNVAVRRRMPSRA